MKLLWIPFADFKPDHDQAIMVRDHEGNRSVGLWHWKEGFINLVENNLGKLMMWSKIKGKFTYSQTSILKIEEIELYYLNDVPINIEEMMEDEPKFRLI